MADQLAAVLEDRQSAPYAPPTTYHAAAIASARAAGRSKCQDVTASFEAAQQTHAEELAGDMNAQQNSTMQDMHGVLSKMMSAPLASRYLVPHVLNAYYFNKM